MSAEEIPFEETVRCLECFQPTGMKRIDPTTIPRGCLASIVVLCAACRLKTRIVWVSSESTRTEDP